MEKTSPKKTLQTALNTVRPCDRCGACLPVCPLFGVKGVEAVSARGKSAITRALAEGGVEPTPDVLRAVDFCLLCRACAEICPNKIRTDEAMIEVRQYLSDLGGGATARYKLLGAILKRRGMVKLAADALHVLRKTGLNRVFPHGMAPEEYTRTHFLTAFGGPAALGRPTPPSPVSVTQKSKIAYFHGCGMEMMFPAAAAETMAILSTTAHPVQRKNVCCGLPHLAHGLRREFLDLARKNIKLYDDVDIVVADCASCSGTLKHLVSYFADDPAWSERAAAFSRKVMDLTEYLSKAGYEPRQKVEATFTYHDPCHLVRGQGIKKEPRELLRAAGKFVEMKEADLCCGGAGSFHIDYPDISAQILDKKRRNIEATGAAVVVTACPGCLIQLNKAAQTSGTFKAMHISQVI